MSIGFYVRTTWHKFFFIFSQFCGPTKIEIVFSTTCFWVLCHELFGSRVTHRCSKPTMYERRSKVVLLLKNNSKSLQIFNYSQPIQQATTEAGQKKSNFCKYSRNLIEILKIIKKLVVAISKVIKSITWKTLTRIFF